ncbi:MAG: cation-transporting P-type ATPase [Acidobacteriota bacterium]
MKIHHFTIDEAIRSLKSDQNGLSTAEANRRLLEFGPNRVEKVKTEPIFFRFLKGFTHFFAVILWVAAGLAFIADKQDPGKGMATLGFAIIGVIFVNGLFSFWQEYKAEMAILYLQKILPHQVKALRDGTILQVPASDLVPGDLILLEAGDGIPADCRVVEAFGVRVNNATVTGESTPLSRNEQRNDDEDLLHSKNILLAGTAMVSGQAKAVVFSTGMHTEFGKIAHLTQISGESLSPLQKEVIYLSRIVAAISIGMGLIFFFIGQVLGFPLWQNLIFAIGIIVANVPEGLLPTVTMALAMASQRMAKRNALIRHLPSVETLGSATVICTDKTGTLTENRMTVKKVFLSDRYYTAESEKLMAECYRLFFQGMFLCHNLKESTREGKEDLLGDPMEIALVQFAKKADLQLVKYHCLDEISFDTDRKRLSTIHRTPEGLIMYTKGALEAILPLCNLVQMEKSIEPLSLEMRENVLQAQESMASEGLRVLALAYRPVPKKYDLDHLEEEMILTGLVGLEDPPRPEVPQAIKICREAGIKVIMLTGDNPHTAQAIAEEIGLVRSNSPVVMTGDQLRRISNTQLQLLLDEPEVIFARLAADQKMRIVGALRKKGEIVAVTGDGVNDAPALKSADIGIAMGISGTDVAREAADIILIDDNFASIVAAIEEGRAVFDNIRKFLTYILTSNIPEIVPYLAFVLFKIPLPLTIIQILAVDLGTDMLPALGLGIEKPDHEAMHNPPRNIKERLVNLPLIIRAYLFLGVMEAIAALSTFFFVLYQEGWRYGENLPNNSGLYLQATTACLSAIIVMQVANVFLCRSEKRSIFAFGFFSNKLIILGIIIEIVLIILIDYTHWGNLIFSTSPIPLKAWLFAIPFAIAMLVIEECRKWFTRGKPSLRSNTFPLAFKSR